MKSVKEQLDEMVFTNSTKTRQIPNNTLINKVTKVCNFPLLAAKGIPTLTIETTWNDQKFINAKWPDLTLRIYPRRQVSFNDTVNGVHYTLKMHSFER